MNWTAIGAIGEVLGAVAVVLSLVYVAAQVRHNTTALSRAASADAIAGIRNWNQCLIEDPVMVRIFSQGVEDMDALDGVGAWLGSEDRSPLPERISRHSVAVRHPEVGHRIENLARELYLDSLANGGPTSHASTDDRLVPVDGILH